MPEKNEAGTGSNQHSNGLNEVAGPKATAKTLGVPHIAIRVEKSAEALQSEFMTQYLPHELGMLGSYQDAYGNSWYLLTPELLKTVKSQGIDYKEMYRHPRPKQVRENLKKGTSSAGEIAPSTE